MRASYTRVAVCAGLLGLTLGALSAHLFHAATAFADTVVPARTTLDFVRSDDPPHEMAQKSNTIHAIVTAYTSSPDETDDTPDINASGTRPSRGSIACPSRLPFGTKIEMRGRIFVCDDRMNDRYDDGAHFDVWVESKDIAYAFGRQSVPVRVIE